MATVTSVPGTLDITPDPLQKQSKVQIRRNNKKGRIEIVTSTDSGSNYKTLLPEVTSKVQAGSIPVVQESGDVEWSVLSAKASTLTGVVPYVNGGTGQSSYAPGDVLYANEQGVLSKLPIGSTDQLLTVNSALPAWKDIKLSDAVLSGLMKFKDPVRVATTEIITGLSTNTNLPATIDGVQIAIGDRILVKNQESTSQNGIYQRSVDTSKYLLKTIAVNASGTGYSINDSLKINNNVPGDTAPTFSVTSLKINSFTLVSGQQGTGVNATQVYTLAGANSTTSATYKVLTTALTKVAIESDYSLEAYDSEELKSLFLCNYSDSTQQGLGNDKVDYKWGVSGATQGSYQLKGMVYSPAATVSAVANITNTSISFNNLTGTDKDVRKGTGFTSASSSSGTNTISFRLSSGYPPSVGDIVSLYQSTDFQYDSKEIFNDSWVDQFDAYLVTVISNVNSVYTITLHTALTSNLQGKKHIYFTSKSLNNDLVRGFLIGDKFTLGLSSTEYTITNVVTQSRALSYTIGSDVCKYGALSGSITFTPALDVSKPVNTTIRYIGKAVPGSSGNSYPVKSRSTALPSSASFPLALGVVDVGLFSSPVIEYSSILNQSTSSLLSYGSETNINSTFPSGTTNQIANNDLRLVPKCKIVSGQITNPGVFTAKPTNSKLTFSDTTLDVSFNTIDWAVNAVSITNGGVLAASTTTEFGTEYVTGTGGTGLTLKGGLDLQSVATFSRTADADTWIELSGSAFKVTDGTANGGSIYFCDSRSSTGVIGTTGVNFTKIAGITIINNLSSIANSGAGANVLQDGAILNDPVIKIRVSDTGSSFGFSASPTYNSYTLNLPKIGSDETIVARNTYDVLNNKTLIQPFITSINTDSVDGSSIVTLPQQTTTLVGTDTTDTLTNKTIESSILTGDTTLSSTSTFTPAAGATLDLSAANVILPTSTLSGFGYKAPVRAATTTNITLSGIQTIDDVLLAAGDRVLVKNQSTSYQNGIYIVSASSWTRSVDLNVWSEASAAVVVVQEGTLNQDTVWLSTANAGGTIGSTAMPWGMIGVDQIGNGLTTQVLVGGGSNTKPVWTTATGTGAPVRADSPTFTGTVTLPSGTITSAMILDGTIVDADINSTASIATSKISGLDTALGLKAPLASPTFTGTPSLPTGTTAVTQSANDNTTALATTAFVTTADNLKANLASPTFTGTPLSTTATVGTNTTQIATTAFVASVATLSSLTSVGTLTGGTWNANLIAGQYGGTGAVNTGKTITLGGNLTTSGPYTTELIATDNTSVTLPTSGTLVNNAVTTLSSLTSVGTLNSPTIYTPTVLNRISLQSSISGGSGTGITNLQTLEIDGANWKSTIRPLGQNDYFVFEGMAQSITGLKTFDTNKLAVKGTSTGKTIITSANASATDYTINLQARGGTLADDTDLGLKANLASPTFTGTVGGITKAMVGLGSVDNTTDAGKPVSTATQNALNLKANIASPTFTGTVGGITKAMVASATPTTCTTLNGTVAIAWTEATSFQKGTMVAATTISSISAVTTPTEGAKLELWIKGHASSSLNLIISGGIVVGTDSATDLITGKTITAGKTWIFQFTYIGTGWFVTGMKGGY